jgi:4-amino-4-deoxy-L-arabinose transferase-like glycosyltransferase
VSGRLAELRAFYASIPQRERLAVAAAMLVTTAIVVAYVLANHPNSLAGDQREYHDMGIFFTDGKPWWGLEPFDEAHPSAYRPPAYPLWVGFWYTLLGASPTKLAIVQSLLAALTVLLSWALARRLFGPRPAIATAWVVAVFPFVWEWFGLLYTEVLAIPVVTLTILLFLERQPTRALAVWIGALMGIGLLIRPTSVFLFAGVAASFILAVGLRRGAGLTALAVGVAALVIVPWTVRNYAVTDGFIPLSAQDGALHGTFNETSANDPRFPYAWRPDTPENQEILAGPTLNDFEYRSELIDLGLDHLADHPEALAEALYWNGLSRFWDIRRPSNSTFEAPFEGRSKTVTSIGLAMHYVLLPLALVGLWRHRRRRSLAIPVLAIAVAATVVFTVAAGTRYRAPLEPLIVTMAVAAFVAPRTESAAATPTRLSPAA